MLDRLRRVLGRPLDAWMDVAAKQFGIEEPWLRAKVNLSFAANRLGRRPHGLGRPLIVSLTSYPPRYPTLHLALISLLRQRVRPDRTELWVYRDDLAGLPPAVRRLERHGLTIRAANRDIKSYTKLIPALIDHPDAYICTADDDICYPQGWLEALTDNVVDGERCVLCHRAHYIRVDADGSPRPYRSWEIETQRQSPDSHLFPTGVGGVLYPPGCFDREVLNEHALLSLAPRADDLWFYWMLRRNGYRGRKVPGRARLRMWAGSQVVSLVASNAFQDQNDVQLKNLLAQYGSPLQD